jgi:hypothetical protein
MKANSKKSLYVEVLMHIYQGLSIEQQFELKVFENSVQQLSLRQSQALLSNFRQASCIKT